jgi:hypothetical protein
VKKKMVLFQYTYFIDKGKEESYMKWVDEVALPYWRTVPGVIMMRSYNELGTGRILTEFEFESFEAWGKTYDDPKMKEIARKFASYTHGLKWNLWDKSSRMPEPIKF